MCAKQCISAFKCEANCTTLICASMFVVQSAAVWLKISMPKHKFSALVLISYFFLQL